jgi:rhamnogalacturonyl hydrolase YesR
MLTLKPVEILLALVLTMFTSTAIFAQQPPPASQPAPPSWAIATADSLMKRYPDYTKAYWKPWNYVTGYCLYGFDMLHRSTGDPKYIEFAKRYIDTFVDSEGNIKTTDRQGKIVDVVFNNVDNMMTGNSIVWMYEQTKDERYRKAAEKIRKSLDTYPRTSDGGFWHGTGLRGQFWIDGVFMSGMFLIRYGQSIGDREYCFDEVTKQITVYAKHGRKGDTGLYYHGWSESPAATRWADKQTGLSPEVWSEGLGWYALILSETLAVLPESHPQRAEVLKIYRDLAAGLKRVQDPKSGRWFQVVDKGDRSDNWTDTSGSAMFVYALGRGIELGILDKTDYAPVVSRGYEGIVANARINSEGLVDVYSACDGLGVQVDYQHYINYKQKVNAKEAVGGFLWATAIVERPMIEKMKR